MSDCLLSVRGDRTRRRVRGASPALGSISLMLGFVLLSGCSGPESQGPTWQPTASPSAAAANPAGLSPDAVVGAMEPLAPGVTSTAPSAGAAGDDTAPSSTLAPAAGQPAATNPDGSPTPPTSSDGTASDGLRTIPISNATFRVLSRLTGRQYLNAAAELLGIETQSFLPLIPDIAPNAGYSNSGYAQSQPYDLILAFDTAAKAMTDKAMSDTVNSAALSARFGGCSEVGCIKDFIAQFGAKAFRRPLTASEVDAFQPILDGAAQNSLSYPDTVSLLVRAVLQSPEFLYLFEDEPLSNYQLASRLAFFVTDGPPDDALLSEAQAGTLNNSERLAYHVDRLLTAHGERFARAFAYDYFGLRKAYQRTVDVDQATLDSLVDSAESTFASLIATDAPITALLTTRSFVADATTAAYLGATTASTTVDAASANGFMGLVTHPATLIAMSNAFEGSMVSRGQFLAHQLLCIPPTPPPAKAFNPSDVGVALPPNPTQRDEGEARLQDPNCLGCHVQFEPYAFALNKWGGDGHFYDDARLNDSGPITTSLGDFAFSGYQDFLPLLAESEQFRRCMTDHFVRYGLRHTDYPTDVVDAVLRSAEQSGAPLTFRNLVRAVIQQPVFSSH